MEGNSNGEELYQWQDIPGEEVGPYAHIHTHTKYYYTPGPLAQMD